jgi:hypothetical protein
LVVMTLGSRRGCDSDYHDATLVLGPLHVHSLMNNSRSGSNHCPASQICDQNFSY